MNQEMHQAGLLLGSNIQAEKNIPLAVGLLAKQMTILQTSSVWESRAVGSDGANFLNAVLLVSTTFGVDLLKDQVLRPLEAQLGRERTGDKNAPRTMDLDILLFDQQVLDLNLWQTAFRAVPMAELLPDFQSESGENLSDAALRLAQIAPIWKRKDIQI